MKSGLRWVLTLLLVLQGGFSFAQITGSGDIRGTVTDSTGALIPGATITVLNVDTGVSKTFTSDSAGLYDTSAIVAGNYKITFKRDGFEQLVRGPITVLVGYTTVNAQLTIGSDKQQVIVNSDVPLLQTETHEQSTTLESKTLYQLPQTGQDWENFTILLPGAAGTSSGGTASNPGQSVAANGNLPYSNFLADGSSTTLVNSGNTDVSIFETVAELQVDTSSFSAEYGIGGIIFNQISKGGTSRFHGSGYEYWQNSILNASNYGFGNSVPVPYLRYNNFGGSIGGPILKQKMFFFFDFDKTLQSSAANNGLTTLPTVAELSGDFTGEQTIYDPTTQVVTMTGTVTQPDGTVQTCPCVTRKSFADEYGNGNKIPSNLIDPVAKSIEALFPTPTNHPPTGKFVPGLLQPNGILANNYYYSLPAPNPVTRYFGRLDYDLRSNNRITLSDTQRDNYSPAYGVYACPVGCGNNDIDSNNAQISDVWNISPSLINEFRDGFTSQLNFFQDGTTGLNYPEKLGWQYSKFNTIPTTYVGAYNTFGPYNNAILKEFTFAPSDVVTLIKGKHILKFGGEFLMYQNNANQWGANNGGTFNFSGQYTQQYAGSGSTGANYADFLLGQAQGWSAKVVPIYGARYKTPQVFVQDDYKIKPNLTLNLGVRYDVQHGWKEVKNNIDSFDPTLVNPSTNTLGAEWFANSPTATRHAAEANIKTDVLPRVGFAWLPKPNMTVRGGFGLFVYNYSLGTFGADIGNPLSSSGSVNDSTGGISPVVTLAGTGANLPFVTAPTSADAYNGQNTDYQAYHTPDIKIMQWNVAVQRTLGTNYVVQVAYVASHGYDLLFPRNMNVVPTSELSPNDQADVPYPQFGVISSRGGTSNAISNYNSLQVSASKRLTSGFSLNFNYTWSHFLDEQDTSAWQNGNSGGVIYQNPYSPRSNYGNSNFDIRQALKGYALYELPFGVGRRFLNKSRAADAIIGGWQLSGTLVAETGNPFTPYIASSNYGNSYNQDVPGGVNQGGFQWFPNVIGNPHLSNRSIYTGWYNPAAFATPANGTYGDEHRNSVYGPGLVQVNLTGGKTFSVWENVKLQIRADATNAFNHPSFGTPNPGLLCTTPGQACTADTYIGGLTVGGRTMQLGAHLTF